MTGGGWIARAAVAGGGYLAVALVCHLSGVQIALTSLAAAVLAGCAVWWFGADLASAASATRWQEPEEYAAQYVRSDPAAGYLTRLCGEVTTSSTRRASPTAPRSLQVIVRELVDERLAQRPLRGLPASVSLPHELDAYLRADPAPRLRSAELDHIVTSIEEL